MVNWDDISVFRTAAEELSFTRAANRLRISKQVVSQRVARLERAVGARLLERTTSAMELTPAGRMLLVWANEADGSWRELLAKLGGTADAAGMDVLRIAFEVGAAVGTDGLEEYRIAAGAREVVWTTMSERAAWTAVAAGEVDVSFRFEPAARPLLPEPGVHLRTVSYEPIWVIGPTQVLDRAGPRQTPVKLTDFADFTWVISQPLEPSNQWEKDLLLEYGVERFEYSGGPALALEDFVARQLFAFSSSLLSEFPGLSVRPVDPALFAHRYLFWNARTVTPAQADALYTAVRSRASRSLS